jgi:hypothetical protein
MLRTDQPPRGSFDYMLRDVDKQVWRDAGLGDMPPTSTGGGGPRVRVEIEIVDQRTRVVAERKARKHARALFWAIVFGLLWGFILLMPKGHAQTMSQYSRTTSVAFPIDELHARLDAEAERIKRTVLLYGR